MKTTVKRVLTEPLLHFLAIGLALFGLYAALHSGNREPATIVVGERQIAVMREVFERTWRRPPSGEDEKAMIDNYVREEVLYREGIAMGLDRDDSLIRRRVRQKVEFLSESMNGVPEPTDALLLAYLVAHRDRFQGDARFTFEQVYLGGRLSQLDERMERVTATDVARAFGPQFAAALAEVPIGAWQGPIKSAYGLHRVRVAEREPAHVPALAEIREQVKREWQREQIAAAGERYYARLRDRYAVRIESPRVAVAP